jgi:glycerol-3-phosphate dehydrogenase subunit C
VAYHQPCHLKAQQVGNPALELLRDIPGLEVIDLAAGCCGMAGTFGMKASSYDFSMLTGAPLFERIAAVDADLVASECSTCRLQIGEATGMRTVHPAMLLAAAYAVPTGPSDRAGDRRCVAGSRAGRVAPARVEPPYLSE